MSSMSFVRGSLPDLQKLSFQSVFTETQPCPCGGTAILIGVVDDPTGELCQEQSRRIASGQVEVWPHDSCSIALYLCGKCLTPLGVFTQG